MPRVTIVGGARDMARVAAGAFSSLIVDYRSMIADFDLKARKFAASFASPAVEAVLASMLLKGLIREKGVLAPEAYVDPAEFARRMDKAMPGAEEAMRAEVFEAAVS